MMEIKKTKNDLELLNDIIIWFTAYQSYPTWDFINKVLSCKDLIGDNQLWFHWGKLLLVRPEDKGKKAGEMLRVTGFKVNEDNMLEFNTKEQGDDEE